MQVIFNFHPANIVVVKVVRDGHNFDKNNLITFLELTGAVFQSDCSVWFNTGLSFVNIV